MSDNRTWTVPDFGPNDLLTSDQIGERAVKVATIGSQSLTEDIMALLYSLSATNTELVEQIKLLNARFEEAFDTKLKEGDI